jgi:signal transduction histidine kinase
MQLTDLGRLLNETVDFLQPLARQRGHQVKIENLVGKVPAQADANRLKQVFLNLSLNAFRAMPPGGELRVRVAWAPQFPGELAQIDFRDQGRGLAPELLERIYEPGFTTTPGSPGLGLSVCKNVIEQHGGNRAARFRSFCQSAPEQTHEQCFDRGRRNGHARGAGSQLSAKRLARADGRWRQRRVE